MKKVAIGLILLLTLALVANLPTTLAKHKQKVGYVFKGPIKEVSATSVKIKVMKANKHGKKLVGNLLSFDLTDETRVIGKDRSKVSDLLPEDNVQIKSKAPKGATSFSARRIIVEICYEKKKRLDVFKGTLNSVSETELKLQVSGGSDGAKIYIGQEVTFAITQYTKIRAGSSYGTINDLAVGDEVKVMGKKYDVLKAILVVKGENDKGDEPGEDD